MPSINKEMVKELEACDPDDLVHLFGLTSDQIIRAFPGHAYDYVRDNFTFEQQEDNIEGDALDELERLQDEGYSILDEPEPSSSVEGGEPS